MPTALVLPLPVDVAAQLALSIEGALPAGDLHLTLAMLDGDAGDLLPAVEALAAQLAPVDVVLSGVGRFSCPDGTDAFHATVDGPTLPELRGVVEALFPEAIDRTHGFDPHVTLAYLAPGDASPLERLDPVAVTFDALALWDGDARQTFPLDGPAMSTPAQTIYRQALIATQRLSGAGAEGAAVADGLDPNDPYTFDVFASDESVDDHGTSLRGWRVERFLRNPVILFNHDHTKVIGKGIAAEPVEGGLRVRVQLAEAGTSAIVDEVRSLRRQDILRGVSVGANPARADIEKTGGREVLVLSDCELVELSVCAVGSNPNALVALRAAALRSTPTRPPMSTAAKKTTTAKPAVTRAEEPPKEPETLPPKKDEPAVERAASDAFEVYAAEVHAAVDTVQGLTDEQRGAVHAAIETALAAAMAQGGESAPVVEASADVAEMRAEVEAAVTRAANAERDALLLRGQYVERKLTPAMAKLYASKSLGELKAYLAMAPAIPALERSAPRTQATGDTLPTGVAGIPEVPFEQLTPNQKHQLLRANKVAFEARLTAYEQRTGPQPQYRALLDG